MNWLDWKPYYAKVIFDLGLDESKDYVVTTSFANLLKQNHPNGFYDVLNKIKEKKISKSWIFGAGPSLEQDFVIFKKFYAIQSDLIVGVDGACLFLIENEIYPDVIFSDLDGSLETLLTCLAHVSILILHAHGDNFDIEPDYYPKYTSFSLLPTVQTKPYEPYLFNFGGFTDGDRAIAGILDWFSNVDIILLGFTFGNLQGKYSKPTKLKNHVQASDFKLKKLAFAKEFIAKLAILYKNHIYNLSTPTEQIIGVSQQLNILLNHQT